jgi:hypothetical protein
MRDVTPRHRQHQLDGQSYEVRSGDLLLRLLQLRGWRISGSVNGSVALEARLPLPRGEELAVAAVGASSAEAVTSLFVHATEAQARTLRRYAAEGDSHLPRAS